MSALAPAPDENDDVETRERRERNRKELESRYVEHNKNNKNINVFISRNIALKDAAWGKHGALLTDEATSDSINYGPGGYKKIMKEKTEQKQKLEEEQARQGASGTVTGSSPATATASPGGQYSYDPNSRTAGGTTAL